MRAQARKYFNILSCSLAEAKTSWTTSEMPSTIVNCMKASFLHYAREVKQTFSSSASNNHKFTLKAEMAAKQAQDAARKPKIPAHEITERDVDILKAWLLLVVLAGSVYSAMMITQVATKVQSATASAVVQMLNKIRS